MKYYDISRTLRANCDYRFIIGGRSNGKSYAVTKHLFEDWYKKGIQWARFTRYDADMRKVLMDGWFPDGVKDYILQTTGEELTYNQDCWWIGKQLVGYAMNLFNQHKYKSSQFPAVDNIVFEEFVPASDYDYLPGEIDLFLSLISTICRHRDVTVYLIGNVIKKHNIYFDYFNIDVDKIRLKQGDLYTMSTPGYKDGARVSIEYAEMSYEAEQEIPRILRVGHNEIATTGEFADDEFLIKGEQYEKMLERKNLKHVIPFRVGVEGKLYHVHTFTDAKKTFNVVTDDSRGILSSHYIYYINPTFDELTSRNSVSKDFLRSEFKDYLSIDRPTFYTDNRIAYYYGTDVLQGRQQQVKPPSM